MRGTGEEVATGALLSGAAPSSGTTSLHDAGFLGERVAGGRAGLPASPAVSLRLLRWFGELQRQVWLQCRLAPSHVRLVGLQRVGLAITGVLSRDLMSSHPRQRDG